ncbi:hypothetical protein BDZ91DRAFT_190558 [Kalaharituber pfeilii]|nr:hypothetical protein BDZ91DRAFT_190558 [Kalaharituber pfeilii]
MDLRAEKIGALLMWFLDWKLTAKKKVRCDCTSVCVLSCYLFTTLLHIYLFFMFFICYFFPIDYPFLSTLFILVSTVCSIHRVFFFLFLFSPPASTFSVI